MTADTAPIREIDVLWLNAGLSCDGDTIAMTAATQPSIEDLICRGLPWIPKINFLNMFLAYGNGTGTDDTGNGEGKLELSEPVQSAIGEAIAAIERTITKFLDAEQERKASLQMDLNDLTDDEKNERDALYLPGGAATILFGAGLMQSLGNLVGTALPDIERYLRMRAM
jgi:hypothetical protein